MKSRQNKNNENRLCERQHFGAFFERSGHIDTHSFCMQLLKISNLLHVRQIVA